MIMQIELQREMIQSGQDWEKVKEKGWEQQENKKKRWLKP